MGFEGFPQKGDVLLLLWATRGHLTKREKSYAKGSCGPKEGVGLEYTLA